MIDKFFKNEKGFSTTFFAIMLPVLISILGLTADGAIIIYHRLALETAADAASLSAIDAYDRDIWIVESRVVLDAEEAEDIAREILAINMPGAMVVEFEVPEGQPGSCKLTAEFEVPTFFLKVFGTDSYTLTAYSTAHGF